LQVQRPRLGIFWITLTSVQREHLTAPDKIATMTEANLHSHLALQREQLIRLQARLRSEVQRAGLRNAKQSSGGRTVSNAPLLHEINMAALTAACGAGCTRDGIHYDGSVYCAAAQQVLNIMARRSGKAQDAAACPA
jgi:hypothetical protein